MATSPNRIAANRLNAQKSTGPKTEAGKARSRANALKHGLTGAGIALPAEDAAAVAQRFEGIQEELAPTTILGSFLAHQMALMTVRCQRAARQETAALASRIRRAPAEFDEIRNAEADHLLGWIAAEPIAYRRKLMSTPEGIDRLTAGLLGLVSELNQPQIRWNFNHASKLAAYFGTRESDLPTARGKILSDAVQGRFAELDPGEVAHLATEADKRNWACDQLVAYIEAEVDRLNAHRATLDLDGIALDRAEAGERALFDPGKEATLARKYEAAATREFYRALREFYAVEAAGPAAPAEPVEPVEPVEPTEPVEPAEAILEAGDAVDLATVGTHPEPQPPIRNNDLERSLASFGKPNASQAKPLGRAVDAPRQRGRSGHDRR